MDPRTVEAALRHEIYWITPCLALGPFATKEKGPALFASGLTHILNVTGEPNALTTDDGFQQVVQQEVEDLELIRESQALRCLDLMHSMLSVRFQNLYVHCTLGQSRAPTVVWLYLIACGLDPEEARHRIEIRNPDALPGHPRLVDEYLVKTVRLHGLDHYQPIDRPEILEPLF